VARRAAAGGRLALRLGSALDAALTSLRTKPLYGEQGSRYPVKVGELWRCGVSLLGCIDLLKLGPGSSILGDFDVVYTDPPWNASVLSTFYGNVGRPPPGREFYLTIHRKIVQLARDKPIWLEGTWRRAEFDRIHELLPGPFTARFPITWARGQSFCALHYSGAHQPPCDPSGLDDLDTPGFVLSHYGVSGIVFDPCMGSGTTALAARAVGWASVGVDLSPRRISQALSRLEDAGEGTPERLH
jgi:hypothetical protein